MTPPPGWRWQRFEAVPSTSDLCVTLAEAGEPDRLAVQAVRQTAPRGSRGRDWVTLPGNLAMSVLLRPACPASDAGHWALLAAVAMAEAIESVSPTSRINLKWPNDLMLGPCKLGGILLDSALRADGRLDWLVIGCGVNVAQAPAGAAALPLPVSDTDVAMQFLTRLDEWDRRRLAEGFGAVRHAWGLRGPQLGTWLRIRTGMHDVGGSFAGLGDTGALLLQTGGQVRAFQTGDMLQAES